MSVCVTPDGQHVVSGSDDTTVRITCVDDGKLVREIKGHTDFFQNNIRETIKRWLRPKVGSSTDRRTHPPCFLENADVGWTPPGCYKRTPSLILKSPEEGRNF